MKKKAQIVVQLWSIALLGAIACPPVFGQKSADNAQPQSQNQQAPGFWNKLRRYLNDAPDKNTGPSSVTEQYSGIYDWIHRDEISLYDSLSKIGITDWDRYQDIMTVTYKKPGPKLASNIKVFGWHPYWMGSAWQSYRFNLLSHVAWFSYNLDPYTGLYDNPEVINVWKASAPLVDSAHAHGCKVLLSVSSHGEAGNLFFLKNPDSQTALANELVKLIRMLNADGIDLNFENVRSGLQDEMTAFVKRLSNKLRTANPDFILSLDLPVYDFNKIYDVKQLLPYVDLFVVTGYDYYNGSSRTDGPVAPLDDPNGGFHIKQSVNIYLQAGLPRNKILLGLPYYGALWRAKVPELGRADSSLSFEGHLTYRALKAKYCLEKPGYDMERWSAWYRVHKPDSNFYEKCWFDDSLTLARKFDWVLEQQLAGVGLWALGYDNGYDELWNMIDAKYASDTVLTYSEPILETKYYRISNSLAAYKSLIAVTGIFLVIFLMAGLIIALFDWRVREIFFSNKTLRLMYALAGVGILFSVIAFSLYISGIDIWAFTHEWSVGIGILIGIAITLAVVYFFEKHRKTLP